MIHVAGDIEVVPEQRGGAVPRALARLARGAPARVFVIEGLAPPDSLEQLRLSPMVHVVESPRSATILLIAGDVPERLRDAVRRLHDAMATPRCTATWRRGATPDGSASDVQLQAHVVMGSSADVADRLVQLQASLVTGRVASEPALLPNADPVEWRGVGPFGQGGTGMTGGVPYGRPMAETAPDRDGLRLDRLDLRVGPFYPPFPPGLVLTMGLQGDVIQDVSVDTNPFAGPAEPIDRDPFRRALEEPVRIAALELARARHHLCWLAKALRVHGVPALGLRALALSEALTPGDVTPVAVLRRLLERTRALAVATVGVGVVSADVMRGLGLGPVARASGAVEDERSDDASYHALGFEPLTQSEGDARARLRQRLAEAEQSVTLAGRAGDATTQRQNRVESPRGALTRSTTSLRMVLGLLPPLLGGMEWGDAVTTIVSLDLDLRDLPSEPSDGDMVGAA